MNDGDVRCAEKIEILKCLPCVSRLVAARYPQRVVKLETAFAPPFEIDAAIFPREWKIASVRPAAGRGCVHHIAEFRGPRAGGDRELPGLAIAPGGSLLRCRQYPLDGRARDRLGPKGAAGKSFAQQLVQDFDALLGAAAGSRRLIEGI